MIAHASQLRRGVHENPHLLNSWKKYGYEAFEFEVVEFCEKADLIPREQYYLDTWRPEFNCGTVAQAPALGIVRSPEYGAKISAALKGVPKSQEHREACRASFHETHDLSALIAKSCEARRKKREAIISRDGGTSKYPQLNDRDWMYEHYCVKKMALQAIANLIGITGKYGKAQVQKAIVNFHNFPTRGRSDAALLYHANPESKRPRKKRRPRAFKCGILNDKAWLQEHYSDRKLSLQDVADLAGVPCRSTVSHALHRHEIPMRTTGDGFRLHLARKASSTQPSLFTP